MHEYVVVEVQAKGEHSERMPFTYRLETAWGAPLGRKKFF